MRTTQTRAKVVKAVLPWMIIGFFAGLLNGLLGAAGGILLVSLLPYLTPPARFHLRPNSFDDSRDLLATSLCVMLPVTVLSAALYWLGGKTTDTRLALAISLPAAAGGLAGAYLLGKIPRELLRKLFGLLVAVSGIRMLWG